MLAFKTGEREKKRKEKKSLWKMTCEVTISYSQGLTMEGYFGKLH